MASYDTGNLTQVDLATGKAHTLKHVAGESPNGLAYSGGDLWITSYGDTRVTEYDPVLHQVINVAHLDNGPFQPTVGFGHLWVPLTFYEEVDEIDLQTGAILAKISTGDTSPRSIAVGDGAVWVTLAST